MLYRYAYLLKGLLGCIGGLMIHLVIGSLYQWGLLNPYITSYFILNGYDNLSTKDTVIIFPIMMFCIGVTMKVGLMLGHRFGYVRVLCANFMCCSLFVFGSSYTSNILCNFGRIFSVCCVVFVGVRAHGWDDFYGSYESL